MNLTTDIINQQIVDEIESSINVKKAVIDQNVAVISQIAEIIINCLKKGNKLLLFGNGGSAADSQHIAAEFVSKFNMDRQALAAIALTTDTSIITSTSNDYHFDRIFARQIEALGRAGDVALGISTSGNSPNVVNALLQAKQKGLTLVAFTGQDGGKLKDFVDICLQVPSRNTARIQEVHITAAHIICNIAEKELCERKTSAFVELMSP